MDRAGGGRVRRGAVGRGPATASLLLLAGCYLSHGLDGADAGATPGPDASALDASTRDAGPRDGGRRDAGVDARVVGEPDAALPDVPDSGFPPGSIEAEYLTYCHRFAAVYCEGNRRCCDLPYRTYGPTCEEEIIAGCTAAVAGLSSIADRITWDRESGDAYLRSLIVAEPRCGPVALPRGRAFFVGHVGLDGDCSARPLPDGAEWTGWFECADGLRCEIHGGEPVAPVGTCRPLGEREDYCLMSEECATDLACVGRTDAVWYRAGACRSPLGLGAECARDFDCASLVCDTGYGRCTTGSAARGWCALQ